MIDGVENAGNWPHVELFREIAETAVKAARTDVSKSIQIIPGPDSERYIIVDKNGDHKVMRKSQPARDHSLHSINDVAAFAVRYKDQPDDEAEAITPVIWVGEDSVIVTNDFDRLRNDRATYQFTKTPSYEALEELDSDGMSQSEFLKLLRVDFARLFVSDGTRRNLIRDLRALRTSQQNVIGQGSGSYEVGTQNTANEKIEWPESFAVELQVLDDASIETVRQIGIILDVRPEDRNGMFRLTPVKQDMLNAFRNAVTEAVDVLKSEVDVHGIPVFRGAPS